jgi:imidazoleglycerol-phosphate dehydratase/histidinol-phosphatase
VSAPVAILDRDGTLVVEPPGEQLDAVADVRLADGVMPALGELVQRGYRLIVVTNQDGLGTRDYPRARWDAVQAFLGDLFASQGIAFESVLVCPHRPADRCRCRKPEPALVDDYLRGQEIDRARSAVVGDRDSDLELARRLGLRGFRVAARGDAAAGWPSVVRRILDGDRRGEVDRRTNETAIRVRVDLAAERPVAVATGIGMLDHLLEQLAFHGGFALELRAAGDLGVDAHHTVEDVGLALGEAIRKALGAKRGLARYGFVAAMDESMARVALDLSGRPYARFRGRFAGERVGELPTALAPHFFRSLATTLGAALHVEVTGEDDHHRLEACFKGVGRALRQACRLDGSTLPTTKGTL